jgi:hypothetical protein
VLDGGEEGHGEEEGRYRGDGLRDVLRVWSEDVGRAWTYGICAAEV